MFPSAWLPTWFGILFGRLCHHWLFEFSALVIKIKVWNTIWIRLPLSLLCFPQYLKNYLLPKQLMSDTSCSVMRNQKLTEIIIPMWNYYNWIEVSQTFHYCSYQLKLYNLMIILISTFRFLLVKSKVDNYQIITI